MSEMMIMDGVLIDSMEDVLNSIAYAGGPAIKDPEVIRKFVTSEKATRYYLDKEMNSRMQEERNTVYLWLDTGFVDQNGNAIFVSLLKNYEGYEGHFTGCAHILADNIRKHYPKRRKNINANYSRFLNKYKEKTAEREVMHIVDVNAYYETKCNDGTEMADTEQKAFQNEIEKQLHMQGFTLNDFATEQVEAVNVIKPEKTELDELREENERLAQRNEKATIAMLYDRITEQQSLMDRMMEILDAKDNSRKEDREEIDKLHTEIDGYKKSFVEIRTFCETERQIQEKRAVEKAKKMSDNHMLLGNHKKILVFGANEIALKDIQGIAKKEYGFEKRDIEYVTDYKKIVDAAGRIQNSDRFYAIIFGACPHKVTNLGAWNSIIEKYEQNEFGPYSFAARNSSNELVLNKMSFKKAMDQICWTLNEQEAI